MSKSLSNVLVVFKVARILAKISFIFCIIGAVCELFACFILPVAYKLTPEVMAAAGVSIYYLYGALVAALFATVGAAVFAHLSERYFKNVLRVGTPFTVGGSKECFRLGITSLIISVAVAFVSAVVLGLMDILVGSPELESELSVSVSLTTGLLFLFLSMLFKHGAELREEVEEVKARENAQAQENENANM